MKPETYQLMRQIEDGHWWFVARRKILASLLGRQDISAQADILEVGCGTGGNIDMLNRFGTVTCVELDENAANLARERKLATVLNGALPDELPEFSRKFDVIALFDVLEHVKEDGVSLQVVSALLKPGGCIVVTVPAFNFLWSQHDNENYHQRRYRKHNLVNLANQCDLSLDYVSYFNFWLFPLVASIRLIRKIIPYQESWRDMQMPNGAINGILQAVFSSERYQIGKLSFPFGISLVAVLKLATHDMTNQA